MNERQIGPIGTASRVLIGLGLLYLAGGAGGLSWGLEWYDPMVGFIALPAVALTLGLVARRRGTEPVRLTGPLDLRQLRRDRVARGESLHEWGRAALLRRDAARRRVARTARL